MVATPLRAKPQYGEVSSSSKTLVLDEKPDYNVLEMLLKEAHEKGYSSSVRLAVTHRRTNVVGYTATRTHRSIHALESWYEFLSGKKIEYSK